MLELGIDEITFVLQLSSSYNYLLKYNEWIDVARRIIDIFCVKADIENSFGEEKILAKGLPKGYTYGYTYGEHDHYFAIAFHEFRRDMGVVVKFSAKSLDYYCYSTGKTVYELLQQIQDDLYTVRTSRVDIALDYIDEDVNINDIYDGYLENRLVILREMKSKKDGSIFNKIVGFQIRGFFNQCDINTIYFGSKQSSSFLRIYDKKYEQMSKKGTKYKEACSCKNWVRFEGVFRNEYAHNIGDELLKVNNDIDFGNLLACIMIQRYRFMDKDNAGNMTETFYVNLLLSNISNMSFILRANESRDNRLLDNILYLLGNSGTISTLYKIKMIWGGDSNKVLEKSRDENISDELWVDYYLDELCDDDISDELWVDYISDELCDDDIIYKKSDVIIETVPDEVIYGTTSKDILDAVWEIIKAKISVYKPNDDCKSWLSKNVEDYRAKYEKFRDYIVYLSDYL